MTKGLTKTRDRAPTLSYILRELSHSRDSLVLDVDDLNPLSPPDELGDPPFLVVHCGWSVVQNVDGHVSAVSEASKKL